MSEQNDQKKVVFITINSSLLYTNFPNPLERLSRVEEYSPEMIFDIGLEDPSVPMMFYQANGRMQDLEELEHSQEEIDYLNKRGLHIALYEPLCSYYLDDPYAYYSEFNCGFYSEFPNEVSTYEDRLRAIELDSIQKYVTNNSLKNVTVHTGDYRVEELYTDYHDMTLICHDLFLKGLVYFYNQDITPKRNMTKKFISTNWRFTPARAVISAVLGNMPADLVWYFSVKPEVLWDTPWLENANRDDDEFYEQLKQDLTYLNDTSPRYLDMPVETPSVIEECFAHHYPDQTEEFRTIGNPVGRNHNYLPLEQYYRESFVDIVNESRYAQPTANISEKVFQSIHLKTPFILVAPPYSLRYLKELGYESFDRWWDEDYDLIENHEDRLKAIVEVIREINSWDWEKIEQVYLEMRPVLEHNLKLLAQFTRAGHLMPRAEGPTDEELIAVQWAANSETRTREGRDE